MRRWCCRPLKVEAMKTRTVMIVLMLALASWFVWMGVRTLNQVDQAQQRRAAQIDQLTGGH